MPDIADWNKDFIKLQLMLLLPLIFQWLSLLCSRIDEKIFEVEFLLL